MRRNRRKEDVTFIVVNVKSVFFCTLYRRCKKKKGTFLGFYVVKTSSNPVNRDFPHFEYTSFNMPTERFFIWLTA